MNPFSIKFGNKDTKNNINSNKKNKINNFFDDSTESNESNNKIISDGTLVFTVDNTIDNNEESQNLIIPCKNKLTKRRSTNSTFTNKIQDNFSSLPEDEIARRVILDSQNDDNLFGNPNKLILKPPNLRDDSIIGGDEADYDTVPVESFGLAMLMGMGYDPDKSIDVISPDSLLNKRRVYDKAGLGSHDILMKVIEKERELETMDILWPSKGLYVKVLDKSDRYYKHKGSIIEIEDEYVIIKFIDGNKRRYKIKYLETVVKEGEDAKVVIPILHPINSSQLLGRIVRVIKRNSSSAIVELSGKSFQLPLDNICNFVNY